MNSDPVAALAEAERRIEESGAGWWYGQRPYVTALDRLPRNLDKLTSKRVDISGTQISDLSGLTSRPDLESLVLNERVSDISAVGGLDRLEELVAYKAPVRDVSALRGCRSVRVVQLNVAAVADLSPLADLPNLERLELWSYRGQALWPEATVRHIAFIHASERSARLSLLTSWPHLSLLSCPGGAIAGALPVLPRIQFLSVPGCDDDAFAALSGFVRLKSLHAYDGSVSDLAPLGGCTELETVSLSATRVFNVEPLLDKVALRALDIAGTPVADISELSWLPSLESLRADRTPVHNLSGWNPNSAIRYLSLAGTKVSTLCSLQGPKLEVLNIERTPVSDLAFITALPSLRGLNVKGTNVRDVAAILAHPTLLYDVSKLDYRDRLGFFLDFADTPLAREDPVLHAISLMDGSAEEGLRQKALCERFGIASR